METTEHKIKRLKKEIQDWETGQKSYFIGTMGIEELEQELKELENGN